MADIHKYTAQQVSPGGVYELKRDGQHCQCPKSALVLPTQNRLSGQIEMAPTRFNCSTLCALASISQIEVYEAKPFASEADGSGTAPKQAEPSKFRFEYVLGCESNSVAYPLDELKASPASRAILS